MLQINIDLCVDVVFIKKPFQNLLHRQMLMVSYIVVTSTANLLLTSETRLFLSLFAFPLISIQYVA